MSKKLQTRIKQLEETSYKRLFPTASFDLVKLIVEQRKEIERLRNLNNAEFDAYLAVAEKTLCDPTNDTTTAKRAALRVVLQEKQLQPLG